jgi:drug/metabolite transporter (DMT)-like permease
MSSLALMIPPRRRPLVAAAAALGAVYLIWGSTYLGIAVAVRSLPPLMMLSLRFLVAGGALYWWSLRRGEARPSRRQWRSAFIVGGLLLFVDTGAVAWAEQRGLDTGLAALLCATIPLWLVGLDGAVSGKRLGRRTILGMAVGLTGVALLVGPSASGLDLPAVAAVLVGVLAWAGGSIYARTAPLPGRLELASGMEMIAGGLLLGVASLVKGEPFQVHAVPASAVLAVAYLTVFGSLVAYTSYGWLIRTIPTKIVSTHAYVNPIVAVFLGWLVLGEPITGTVVAAGALILLSVVLLVGRRRRVRPRPEPVAQVATLPIVRHPEAARIAA